MSTDDLRLFVGVPLPLAYHEKLECLREKWGGRLQSKVSWTRQGNWHLTLQFLGHVPVDKAEGIIEALSFVSAASFAFQGGGAGFFPNARRPRVAWVGLSKGREESIALAGSIARALHPLGFDPDRAEFKPHLTICRIREDRGDHWKDLQTDLARMEWPEFTVDRFVLWKSRLSPMGAQYDALGEYRIGGETKC